MLQTCNGRWYVGKFVVSEAQDRQVLEIPELGRKSTKAIFLEKKL
jgi:hypothetical protein